MLSINKMSEGYKITKIGGAKPPTPEPELRGSVASEMLSQEEIEGEIEQRVEELIELDVCRHDIAGVWVAIFSRSQRYRCQQEQADRVEVVALLVRFASLPAPSEHLRVTVEALKDEFSVVDAELEEAAKRAREAAAVPADMEPEPEKMTQEEESDEDDSL